MEVEAAIRRHLLQQDAVTGYVGTKVFKFRLEEPVSGLGLRAIVVRRSNGWARPDSVKTPEYPIVLVECYADDSRDAEGNVSRADAEENALALYRVVDPLLHGARGVWWGAMGSDPGLMVVTCQRWAEPNPARAKDLHGNDERRSAVGDGAVVSVPYALQVAH